MALTADEKKLVLGLTVGMFNLAPDQAIFDDLANAFEGRGKDLFALANDLAQTGAFQNKTASLTTNEAKADYLIANFAIPAGAAADAAKAYYLSQLDTKTIQELAVETLLYLNDDTKRKAAFDDAKKALDNKIAVAEFFISTGYKAQHLSDLDVVSSVTSDPATVDAAKAAIDAVANKGIEYTMDPAVDNFVGSEKNDVITATLADIGPTDVISDPSTTDNDTLNITTTGNVPNFSAINIENININFDTAGGNSVNAQDFSGSTVTVYSERAGFSGAITVNNIEDNNVKAGNQITTLTVAGINGAVIDAGEAATIIATAKTGTEDISLIANGDVALNATTSGALDITATKDSVVDITGSAATITNAAIHGENTVTLRTTAATLTGDTITKDDTATVVIDLTNNANFNMVSMDVQKLIVEPVYTSTVTFKSTLDVVMQQAGNGATFEAPVAAQPGATPAAELNVELTQAANGADTYTYNTVATPGITHTTINATKGGVIAAINDGGSVAGLVGNTTTVVAGADLSITAANLTGQTLELNDQSVGDIVIGALDARSLVATTFEHDLVMTEAAAAAANPLTVLAGKGKNSITTSTTTANVLIKTQDSDDTINANSVTTGRLDIETAAGNDTVTATGMTTSVAKIDTGAGNDTVTVQNTAGGNVAVTAGEGDDTITITNATLGVVTVNADAGDDIINVSNTGVTAQNTTINGGDGHDIIDVVNASDFTASTFLIGDDVEELRIDTAAEFSDAQLANKTLMVTSGTPVASDVLTIDFGVTVAAPSIITKEVDLSGLTNSVSSATEVEYNMLDLSAAAGNEIVKTGHNATQVVDITGGGSDTIYLNADSIGVAINNLQGGAPQTDVTTAMLTTINTANVDFDVAVISGFASANDTLALGTEATATNYTEISIGFDGTAGAPNAGIEDFLAQAITAANAQMAANSSLDYVYVYDDGTDGAGAADAQADAWLLWDTDNDHAVDAAILLVGVEAANNGTGFDASDVIAG